LTPDDPAASLLFDPSGLETNTNDFYIKFGVELGTLFAQENNLVYAPPFDAAPPDVKAYPLAGTVDFRWQRSRAWRQHRRGSIRSR
jgi:hypothetical protein